MISLKPRFSRKIYLLIFILVIVVMAGVAWQNSNAKHTKGARVEAKYISLGGGYIFSIPAKYAVNETANPGVAVVYSQDITTPPSAKNLDELYSSGVVTVQPVKQLKNSDAKTFKDYVTNTAAADLQKKLNSGSDIKFLKKGDVEAAEVSAILNSGTVLRAAYVLDLPQPVMVVAKEKSDAFKIVSSNLEDLHKTNLKSDITLAAQAAKTVADMLRRQDASGIKGKGTSDFNKNVSKDQLVANLSSSASFLNRSITVVGGSYNGQDFILQLALEPKTKDELPASGVLSLSKQGQNWKLNGFQLPQ